MSNLRPLVTALVLASAPALAASQEVWPPQKSVPVEVMVSVGQTYPFCGTGEITCPVAAAICDDVKVAVVVETPDGPAWKGVGPGVTLCGANAVSGQGMRRVFRVTVR
ncbi:MAG TPA: hypothetical protein VMG32_03365 [Anaeromyxobacteraceae bacterium]|nr:hypothetical protein [Anaeromyxobacteraceae bacterium]